MADYLVALLSEAALAGLKRAIAGPEPEPVAARAPLGEGCECVKVHSPKTYVPADHHVLPQSWGGRTVAENLVRLCPNAHTSTHRLLDEYVRAGGDPGYDVRHQYSFFIQRLALRAWEQRPARPTITSLPHLVP